GAEGLDGGGGAALHVAGAAARQPVALDRRGDERQMHDVEVAIELDRRAWLAGVVAGDHGRGGWVGARAGGGGGGLAGGGLGGAGVGGGRGLAGGGGEGRGVGGGGGHGGGIGGGGGGGSGGGCCFFHGVDSKKWDRGGRAARARRWTPPARGFRPWLFTPAPS